MKIIFFNQSTEIGGTDTFLTNLIAAWPDKNDQLIFWANRMHKGLPLYRSLGIECVTTAFPSKEEISTFFKRLRLFPALSRIVRIMLYLSSPLIFILEIGYFYFVIKRNRFTAIFSNNGGYPAGEMCQSLIIAAKLAGVRKIFLCIHNDPVPTRFPFKTWGYFVDRAVSWSCSEIISVSRSCAGNLGKTRGFKRDIRVIYNGIPANRISKLSKEEKRQRLGIDNKVKLIGSIGNYEERKGYEYLIRGFTRVIDRFPEAKLCIIGSPHFDYAKELERLVKVLGLTDKVILAGYLPDAWEYIECFDLLVVPSVEYESFGLTILETMFYGKVVIGTSVGGIPEVIGDAGFIVPPRDPQAIAESILYVYEHVEEAKRLGEKGFKRFCDNFTLDKMVGRYYEMFAA